MNRVFTPNEQQLHPHLHAAHSLHCRSLNTRELTIDIPDDSELFEIERRHTIPAGCQESRPSNLYKHTVSSSRRYPLPDRSTESNFSFPSGRTVTLSMRTLAQESPRSPSPTSSNTLSPAPRFFFPSEDNKPKVVQQPPPNRFCGSDPYESHRVMSYPDPGAVAPPAAWAESPSSLKSPARSSHETPISYSESCESDDEEWRESSYETLVPQTPPPQLQQITVLDFYDRRKRLALNAARNTASHNNSLTRPMLLITPRTPRAQLKVSYVATSPTPTRLTSANSQTKPGTLWVAPTAVLSQLNAGNFLGAPAVPLTQPISRTPSTPPTGVPAPTQLSSETLSGTLSRPNGVSSVVAAACAAHRMTAYEDNNDSTSKTGVKRNSQALMPPPALGRGLKSGLSSFFGFALPPVSELRADGTWDEDNSDPEDGSPEPSPHSETCKENGGSIGMFGLFAPVGGGPPGSGRKPPKGPGFLQGGGDVHLAVRPWLL